MGVLYIILLLPIIINNYTAEEFAVFVILTQLMTIYGFLDLGIGSILINKIIYYRNKDQVKIIRTVVFQTLKFLIYIALFFILVFMIFYHSFGIEFLRDKFNPTLYEDINLNYSKLTILFFLILPTTLIQKIQFGFLDNTIFHISEIIQKVFNIIIIYYLVKQGENIVTLIYCTYLIIFLINIINIGCYFLYFKKDVFFSFNIAKNNYIPSLIKKSFYFFLAGIFFFFSRTIDSYLINDFGSSDHLRDYEIIKRPFDIGLTTIIVITSVLWPMLGEAHQKKQFDKVKNMLYFTLIGVLLGMGVLLIIMLFTGNDILQVWLNKNINFTNTLFILVGLMSLLYGLGNVLSIYLNSINVFLIQLKVYLVLALIGIPFKIYALSYYGLKGYLIATVILLTFIYFIPMLTFSIKKLKSNLV